MRKEQGIMTEYGIFSEAAGGCIYAPCYSPEEAEKELLRLITQDEEDPEDLGIKELCPDHEEQPKDGCEECYSTCPACDDAEECRECDGAGCDKCWGGKCPEHR